MIILTEIGKTLNQSQFDSDMNLGNGKIDLSERNDCIESPTVHSVVVNINEGISKLLCVTTVLNFLILIYFSF